MTLHRYSAGTRDAHGNALALYSSEPVSGCVFAPGQTSEATQGAEEVTSDDQVYFPAVIVISPLDRWEYPAGVTYEVLGAPSDWISPFSGNESLKRCRVRQVTGVSAHTVAAGAGGG
jgi:hypothetical protein